jgi:hypothetical protein
MAASGDVYVGNFKNWMRHGQGTQIWTNGDEYHGTWFDDAQLEGVFFGHNGDQWKGNYQTKRVVKLDAKDKVSKKPSKAKKEGESEGRLVRLPNSARHDKSKKGAMQVANANRTARRAGTVVASTVDHSKPFDLQKFIKESISMGLQMRTRGRFETMYSNDTPGPGTYTPEVASSGPKFSMVSRHVLDTTDTTPGPIYKHEEKRRMRNATISPKPMFPQRRDANVPGPGTYHTRQVHNSNYVPGAPIGKAKQRQPMENSIGPGPASGDRSEEPARFGNGAPSITMLGRKKDNIVDRSEESGPFYPRRDAARGAAFGKGKRSDGDTRLGPGPAKYLPVLSGNTSAYNFRPPVLLYAEPLGPSPR